MTELNDEQLKEQQQQLEARFSHTDRDHPAIKVLFELQLDALKNNQSE